MIKVNNFNVGGFDENGRIIETLNTKSKSCFDELGNPTNKFQIVLLHNEVLRLSEEVEVLKSKLKEKNENIIYR